MLPCDNAQQHVQLVQPGSAITAPAQLDGARGGDARQRRDRRRPLEEDGRRRADPVVTRYHPQTGKLQVVAVRRGDTGQFAVPGGMSKSPGEKWNDKMWSALEEDLQQEDDSPLEQQHMKALLHDLFQGEESTVVYRGCESSLFEEPGTL